RLRRLPAGTCPGHRRLTTPANLADAPVLHHPLLNLIRDASDTHHASTPAPYKRSPASRSSPHDSLAASPSMLRGPRHTSRTPEEPPCTEQSSSAGLL